MEITKRYKKLIQLITLFIIMTLITIGIKYYFKPLLFMVLVYFLCNPIYIWLIKFKIPSKLAGTISILFVNIFIILVIIYAGNTIIKLLYSVYLNNIEFLEKQFISIYSTFQGISKLGLTEKVFSLLNDVNITTKAINTGENFISYIIGNIASFFILIDKKSITILLKKLLPKELIDKIIINKKYIKQFIAIEINLVIMSTLITYLGFKILNIPNAFVLSIICGVLDVLPYIGTIIVFIPIIIYNIIVKDYFLVIGIICLYILIQVLREILEAKFLSDKLQLHPLLVILSVYIGIKLFGFIGLIVGPMYGILAKDIIFNEKLSP